MYSFLFYLEKKIIIEIKHLLHPEYRRIKFPRISFKPEDSISLDRSRAAMFRNTPSSGNDERKWMILRTKRSDVNHIALRHFGIGKSVPRVVGSTRKQAVNATARTCVRNVIKIWNCLSAEREKEARLMPPRLWSYLRFVTRLIIIILPRAIAKSREIYLLICPFITRPKYSKEKSKRFEKNISRRTLFGKQFRFFEVRIENQFSNTVNTLSP